MLPPRRRAHRVIVPLLAGAALTVMVGALLFAGAMLWALHDLPLARALTAGDRPSLLLETADSRPMGRIGPLSDPAPARSDFPTLLVNAVLAIEDRRFFDHAGVDPWGIIRAARMNAAAGEIVEGGSTITQQLVKIRLVGRERSMDRKLREALTALWLDYKLGKDEILTQYLNSVYLGAGAYGMAAGARVYFDKQLSALTLAEAAMLAGLIKAPSEYNPIRNPEAARSRAALVLDAMVETGTIDAASAAQAKARPATVRSAAETARAESWFADWIAKHEAPKVAGADTRSLRLRTTLVPELQEAAERVVTQALTGPAAKRGAKEAALVAMRPDGAVVAMVGGRSYDQSQFNRAADARRQPGSAFKLFVYLAALRSGYGPDDVIDASPVHIKGWEPENFGGRRFGRLTLEQAFAQSVNTAAVRLATNVGLDKVVAAARDLGIDAPLPAVPSLALGTAEVSLIDLTGAFASVRSGRTRLQPYGIVAFGPEKEGLRSLGAPAGTGAPLAERDDLIALLRGVVAHGTARGAGLDASVAGKTGTSQDHRDAWFVGFNEQLVVGVWVGNDDQAPMKDVTGGSLPAQIWKQFVDAAGAIDRRIAAAAPASDARAPSTEGRASFDAGAVSEGQTIVSSAGPDADAPRCNIDACAAQHRSFRADDCTYRSRRGRRRVCDIPSEITSRPAPAPFAQVSPGGPTCNIDRCARHYRSFDPEDCTYQPHGGGPRRVCDR